MITWKQDLGYIVRWIFNFHFFSVRVHKWHSSDDLRNLHDHPWWYFTIILKGNYTDITESGEDVRKRWSWRLHPATYKHSVKVPKEGCWTLLITGREIRKWGFWVNGKFWKRNKYFFKYGHH